MKVIERGKKMNKFNIGDIVFRKRYSDIDMVVIEEITIKSNGIEYKTRSRENDGYTVDNENELFSTKEECIEAIRNKLERELEERMSYVYRYVVSKDRYKELKKLSDEYKK
jgi:ABC-type uncharacterized transport system ATPase component